MSINSRMQYVELQVKEEVQATTGQFKEQWTTVDEILMSISQKEDRIYRNNTLEVIDNKYMGITYSKGIKKGKNRIKLESSIFNIESVNDSAVKSIIILREIEPSGI